MDRTTLSDTSKSRCMEPNELSKAVAFGVRSAVSEAGISYLLEYHQEQLQEIQKDTKLTEEHALAILQLLQNRKCECADKIISGMKSIDRKPQKSEPVSKSNLISSAVSVWTNKSIPPEIYEAIIDAADEISEVSNTSSQINETLEEGFEEANHSLDSITETSAESRDLLESIDDRLAKRVTDCSKVATLLATLNEKTDKLIGQNKKRDSDQKKEKVKEKAEKKKEVKAEKVEKSKEKAEKKKESAAKKAKERKELASKILSSRSSFDPDDEFAPIIDDLEQTKDYEREQARTEKKRDKSETKSDDKQLEQTKELKKSIDALKPKKEQKHLKGTSKNVTPKKAKHTLIDDALAMADDLFDLDLDLDKDDKDGKDKKSRKERKEERAKRKADKTSTPGKKNWKQRIAEKFGKEAAEDAAESAAKQSLKDKIAEKLRKAGFSKAEERGEAVEKAAEKAKEAASRTAEKAKEASVKASDKAKELAQAASEKASPYVEKGKGILSSAGEKAAPILERGKGILSSASSKLAPLAQGVKGFALPKGIGAAGVLGTGLMVMDTVSTVNALNNPDLSADQKSAMLARNSGAMLGSAIGTLGGPVGVMAGQVIGAEVGEHVIAPINKAIASNPDLSDAIGSTVAKGLSLFGNEEAKEALRLSSGGKVPVITPAKPPEKKPIVPIVAPIPSTTETTVPPVPIVADTTTENIPPAPVVTATTMASPLSDDLLRFIKGQKQDRRDSLVSMYAEKYSIPTKDVYTALTNLDKNVSVATNTIPKSVAPKTVDQPVSTASNLMVAGIATPDITPDIEPKEKKDDNNIYKALTATMAAELGKPRPAATLADTRLTDIREEPEIPDLRKLAALPDYAAKSTSQSMEQFSGILSENKDNASKLKSQIDNLPASSTIAAAVGAAAVTALSQANAQHDADFHNELNKTVGPKLEKAVAPLSALSAEMTKSTEEFSDKTGTFVKDFDKKTNKFIDNTDKSTTSFLDKLKANTSGVLTSISSAWKGMGGIGGILQSAKDRFKQAIDAGKQATEESGSVLTGIGQAGKTYATGQGVGGSTDVKYGAQGGIKYSANVDAAISNASKSVGVDENFMRTMAAIESHGDPSVTNKLGYKGLYQFGDSTAKSYIKGDVYDASANAMGAAKYAKDNAAYFKKRIGRDASPAELYMMHQQGPAGAVGLIKAEQEGKGWDQLDDGSRKRMSSNLGAGKSAKEFNDMWRRKYANYAAQVETKSGVYTASSAVGNLPTASATEPGKVPGMDKIAGSLASGMVSSVNQSLYSQTEDAINKGIKYGFGSKNLSSGAIDCSGWVSNINRNMIDGINQASGKELFDKSDKAALNAGASDIIKNVSQKTGVLNTNVKSADQLKEGMVIGLDSGDHGWDKGRYEGIDHITQVVRNPTTGELEISESSSKKGVHTTNAQEWLDRQNKKGNRLFATDPLAMAEGGRTALGDTPVVTAAGLAQPSVDTVSSPTVPTGVATVQTPVTSGNTLQQAYAASGGPIPVTVVGPVALSGQLNQNVADASQATQQQYTGTAEQPVSATNTGPDGLLPFIRGQKSDRRDTLVDMYSERNNIPKEDVYTAMNAGASEVAPPTAVVSNQVPTATQPAQPPTTVDDTVRNSFLAAEKQKSQVMGLMGGLTPDQFFLKQMGLSAQSQQQSRQNLGTSADNIARTMAGEISRGEAPDMQSAQKELGVITASAQSEKPVAVPASYTTSYTAPTSYSDYDKTQGQPGWVGVEKPAKKPSEAKPANIAGTRPLLPVYKPKPSSEATVDKDFLKQTTSTAWENLSTSRQSEISKAYKDFKASGATPLTKEEQDRIDTWSKQNSKGGFVTATRPEDIKALDEKDSKYKSFFKKSYRAINEKEYALDNDVDYDKALSAKEPKVGDVVGVRPQLPVFKPKKDSFLPPPTVTTTAGTFLTRGGIKFGDKPEEHKVGDVVGVRPQLPVFKPKPEEHKVAKPASIVGTRPKPVAKKTKPPVPEDFLKQTTSTTWENLSDKRKQEISNAYKDFKASDVTPLNEEEQSRLQSWHSKNFSLFSDNEMPEDIKAIDERDSQYSKFLKSSNRTYKGKEYSLDEDIDEVLDATKTAPVAKEVAKPVATSTMSFKESGISKDFLNEATNTEWNNLTEKRKQEIADSYRKYKSSGVSPLTKEEHKRITDWEAAHSEGGMIFDKMPEELQALRDRDRQYSELIPKAGRSKDGKEYAKDEETGDWFLDADLPKKPKEPEVSDVKARPTVPPVERSPVVTSIPTSQKGTWDPTGRYYTASSESKPQEKPKGTWDPTGRYYTASSGSGSKGGGFLSSILSPLTSIFGGNRTSSSYSSQGYSSPGYGTTPFGGSGSRGYDMASAPGNYAGNMAGGIRSVMSAPTSILGNIMGGLGSILNIPNQIMGGVSGIGGMFGAKMPSFGGFGSGLSGIMGGPMQAMGQIFSQVSGPMQQMQNYANIPRQIYGIANNTTQSVANIPNQMGRSMQGAYGTMTGTPNNVLRSMGVTTYGGDAGSTYSSQTPSNRAYTEMPYPEPEVRVPKALTVSGENVRPDIMYRQSSDEYRDVSVNNDTYGGVSYRTSAPTSYSNVSATQSPLSADRSAYTPPLTSTMFMQEQSAKTADSSAQDKNAVIGRSGRNATGGGGISQRPRLDDIPIMLQDNGLILLQTGLI